MQSRKLIIILAMSIDVYAKPPLELEVMNIGQGAANFLSIIDKSKKVVVAFDCGSGSQFGRQKFEPKIWDSDGYTPIAIKPESEKPKTSATNTPADTPPRSSEGSVSGAHSTDSGEVPAANQHGTSRIELKAPQITHMAKLISDADYFVCVLSHSDVDHINYISEVLDEALKQSGKHVPILSILGGNWFSSELVGEPGHATSVKNTLEGLMRHNAEIILPYYLWQNGTKTGESLHKALAQVFQANKKNMDVALKKVTELTSNGLAPQTFTGSVSDLLAQTLTERSKVFDAELTNPLLKTTLDRIRLWNINTGSNTNAQSIVVSYTDEARDISFVLTGDAEDSSFMNMRGAIRKEKPFGLTNENDVLRQQLSTTTQKENHMVFMTVPHHGSHRNISPSAYATFMPDAFIFSAGDGLKEAHPGIETYQKIIAKNTPWFARAKKWLNKFTLQQEMLIPFFKRNIGEKKELSVKFYSLWHKADFLFFATHSSGNISIASILPDGAKEEQLVVRAQNSNRFSYDEKEYRLRLSQSIGTITHEQAQADILKIDAIIKPDSIMYAFLKKLGFQDFAKIDDPNNPGEKIYVPKSAAAKDQDCNLIIIPIQKGKKANSLTKLYIGISPNVMEEYVQFKKSLQPKSAKGIKQPRTSGSNDEQLARKKRRTEAH